MQPIPSPLPFPRPEQAQALQRTQVPIYIQADAQPLEIAPPTFEPIVGSPTFEPIVALPISKKPLETETETPAVEWVEWVENNQTESSQAEEEPEKQRKRRQRRDREPYLALLLGEAIRDAKQLSFEYLLDQVLNNLGDEDGTRSCRKRVNGALRDALEDFEDLLLESRGISRWPPKSNRGDGKKRKPKPLITEEPTAKAKNLTVERDVASEVAAEKDDMLRPRPKQRDDKKLKPLTQKPVQNVAERESKADEREHAAGNRRNENRDSIPKPRLTKPANDVKERGDILKTAAETDKMWRPKPSKGDAKERKPLIVSKAPSEYMRGLSP